MPYSVLMMNYMHFVLYSMCQRYKMGVCAMLFCVQRGIVVTFGLLFPDLHKMVDLFNLLYSGFAGFLLVAGRHELHIIPKEVTYSKRASS